MKKTFYIIFLLFLSWWGLFLKTEIFLKKQTCSSNIYIYSLDELNHDLLCSNLNGMYRKLEDLSLNIKILILPKWLYTVLTFNPETKTYLNIFNKTVYLNDKYKNFSNAEEIDLFIKLYSLKNLTKMPLLSYISIPEWKLIGYASYIYEDYSAFSLSDFCQKNDSKNFVRFENKIVIKYLIEVKEYNEKRIFEDNLSYSYYLDEAKLFYCK